MAETMEQYMIKTRADYGLGVARPKTKDKDNFELKGQFLRELRTNTFSGSDHEDANEHIEKFLEIVDLFHIPNITIDQEVILFYNGLGIPTRHILDSKGAIPSKTVADAKVAIQEMAEYSKKWHNRTSSQEVLKLLTDWQLYKVPRQSNMYNFDLRNVVPSGDVTCLFANAIIDESKLWHRRLGHVNFKTMNKLVKENLVRGLPSKILVNDHTCVACQKKKQH
ncbi:transposase, Ptta/En/Spm, transposase, Tnp1/En/Spm-like protein, partial [Tanacetum coccineum]